MEWFILTNMQTSLEKINCETRKTTIKNKDLKY